MAELKTKARKASVLSFLKKVPDERRRNDALTLLGIMKEITKEPPVLWGPSIVGFGRYHYRYASGHEGDACRVGFSPRKDALVLYVDIGREEQSALLPKLGPCKTGKSCLYLRRLDDVHLPTLKRLVSQAYHAGKTGEPD